MTEHGLSTTRPVFSLGTYCDAMVSLVKRPSRFFLGLPDDIGLRFPATTLLFSVIFSSAAGLMLVQTNRLVMFGVLFLNGALIPFIAAGIGYLLASVIMNIRVGFPKFFAVYAFANGVVLLVSWVPALVMFTEPWKWILIGIGLVKGLGFSRFQAIFLVIVSVCLMIVLYWMFASLSPLGPAPTV